MNTAALHTTLATHTAYTIRPSNTLTEYFSSLKVPRQPSELFCFSKTVLASCFKMFRTWQCRVGEFVPKEKFTIQGYGVLKKRAGCAPDMFKKKANYFAQPWNFI